MDYHLSFPALAGRNLLIGVVITGILIGLAPVFESKNQEAQAGLLMVLASENPRELALIEGNSLVAFSNPLNPPPPTLRKIQVIVTAYSSSPWETDEEPYLTAAGTWVRDGIIANNYLPFGTKVKIPELYGDKIFVVEDRMSWKKGNYHVDIWFPTFWEAKNFGAKTTYIEILES
jgi:3D (Asp-Asp-Asp) domain-containing protein